MIHDDVIHCVVLLYLFLEQIIINNFFSWLINSYWCSGVILIVINSSLLNCFIIGSGIVMINNFMITQRVVLIQIEG